MNDLITRLNTEFGVQIFSELLGFIPKKNGERVRLFDSTRTSQDFFYFNGKKLNFPHVHNYSSGETYTPITAYAKAHRLNNSEAVKELKAKYILDTYTPKRTYTPQVTYKPTPKPPLEIDRQDFIFSIQNQHNSNLVKFMQSLFGNEVTEEVLRFYFVGSTKSPQKYDTAFWYCDSTLSPLNAKIMAYSAESGKRNKNINPNWYHFLKGKEKPNFGFFGEYLDAPTIWIVESEKTALFVKAYFLLSGIKDIAVWACGGKQFLCSMFEQSTRQDLYEKRFILVPDCDTENKDFQAWQNIGAEIANDMKLNILISPFLSENLTPEQKAQKYDIADLICELVPRQKIPYRIIKWFNNLAYCLGTWRARSA